ncbi:hypothetical protein STEG23_006344, partial [Scotinomys teguina]
LLGICGTFKRRENKEHAFYNLNTSTLPPNKFLFSPIKHNLGCGAHLAICEAYT